MVGASPAETAMVLPLRSSGLEMPESAKTCTADGVVCRKTPTLLMPTPLSMFARTAGVSAQPKSTCPCPTACAVFVEPWPALIVRSMPCSSKMPWSTP
ncbi:Uncharacterised protein [Mycobacterium tuberculosis]|nr:Uncharacterised protein [Mycobacterium tuberculosis]